MHAAVLVVDCEPSLGIARLRPASSRLVAPEAEPRESDIIAGTESRSFIHSTHFPSSVS